jgi:putative methyltransferase (TIGR04325 family)
MEMANIENADLTRVIDFIEAQANSNSYQDPELIRNLESQFREESVNRVNRIIGMKSVGFEPSVRKQQLLLGLLSSLGHGKMQVADVGGGNGYMRDWAYGIIDNDNLKWSVFESVQVASSYKKFQKNLNIEFKGIDEFNSTQEFDLTILSCVLQYLSNWEQILETALGNSKSVLIMRTPIIDVDQHQFYIQQNKSGIYGRSQSSWPFIMFSKGMFEKIIADKMNLVFFSVDPEETFPFDGRNLPMSSYYLKRK